MPKLKQKSNLKAAMALAKNYDWQLLPVHCIKNNCCSCGDCNCRSPGKHPIASLVPHGLKDASNDKATIREWWHQCPNANIGVLTGVNFWCLDVDGKKGIESFRELSKKNDDLPDIDDASSAMLLIAA